MKINKSILALALGLSTAGLVNAETIYVTGSTAARSAFYAACTTAGQVFTAVPQITTYGKAPASANGATYMIFTGTLNVAGNPVVTISTDWSGSEAGIKDVALNHTEAFAVPTAGELGQFNAGAPTTTAPFPVTLAMADNAQSYSFTASPAVTGSEVGVIPFEYVRNNGLFTGGNVTDTQIRAALGGFANLSLFTGGNTANDINTYVYVSGRDNSSGTRANAFGTSGFGIKTTPVQIEVSAGGVMQQVPPLSGIYGGDFGYSSGGTLAGTMGSNTAGSTDNQNGPNAVPGFSVIAYLGYSDAATAVADGATALTYDGVAVTEK